MEDDEILEIDAQPRLAGFDLIDIQEGDFLPASSL
jgi:hypothetical protein